MERKAHWDDIYTLKSSNQVSWYQQHLQVSLDLIANTGVDKNAQIIDVGGGTATLVDDLVEKNYQNVTVLDISAVALQDAKARLGERSTQVTWLEADITQASLPDNHYDVWHDRAVFHFLTNPQDRQSYISLAKKVLKPNAHIIVATFALDGPTKCSGLDIVQYSPDTLHSEFGGSFVLVESRAEQHATPFGSTQSFIYCYCKKR